MKFNNGYFGACICVLALLGTASCGFFLNIEKDTREVTNYEYTADVSGLFSYTDAPEYIDYNPSSNLNGYDDNVVYTPSNVVNNYRYKIADGGTTTESLTVTNSSDYPGDYGNFQFGHSDYGYVEAPDVRFLWNGNIDFGSASTIYGKSSNALVQSIGTPIENSKIHITKFTNLLNSLNADLSIYATIEFTITYNSTYPVLFYSGAWDVSQVPSDDGYKYAYHTTLNESNSMPDRLVINTASNLVTAYRNNSIIWTTTADNVGVLAWYSCKAGGYANWVSCSATLSATLTEPPTYGYMNPNAGVKATTTEATWSNGYHNNVIDIKVIKNGDNNTWPHTLQFTIGTSTVHTVYTGSGFRVGVNNISPFTDIGNWLGVQIRLNGSDGSVTFTPTNDLDMLSTVEPTDYSLTFENVFTPGDIDSFKVKTIANTSKFQVTGTKVFLNTYNTVMVDPSINVGNYFPNYDEYRLNFYSFAILGDSITINGQTCPVNKENGTVTFRNAADFEFTKTLANIYLTFQDGHTYLTFVNDSSVYDLGETVNSTVSFSGMWYFTTGLYKAVDGIETFWNLDLDGMFHATAGECLLIFIGIIGLGTIVYTVWGRGKLGTYDWIVIIFSIFLGSCLLGF